MVKRARLLLDDGERIPVELLRDGFDDDGGFESRAEGTRHRDRRKGVRSDEPPRRTAPIKQKSEKRQQAGPLWPVANPESPPTSSAEEA